MKKRAKKTSRKSYYVKKGRKAKGMKRQKNGDKALAGFWSQRMKELGIR